MITGSAKMGRLTIFKSCLYVLCVLLLFGNGYSYAENLKAKAEIIDNTGKSVGSVLFTEGRGGPGHNRSISAFIYAGGACFPYT